MPGYWLCDRFACSGKKFTFRRILVCYILFFLAFSHRPASAQRKMIDSLRSVLPTLQDSARIDCLNTLGSVYCYLQPDSASAYAERAYHEAESLRYMRGIAMSMNNQAHIAGFGRNRFELQEVISLRTIPLSLKIQDDQVLIDTYMNLALAFYHRSKFDRAVNICDSVIERSKAVTNQKALGEALAILGAVAMESGQYEKAFENYIESLKVFTRNNDAYNIAIILVKLGDLYRLTGNRQKALQLYFQSLDYAKGTSLQWHPLDDLGDTYHHFDAEDSIDHVSLQSIKSLTIRNRDRIFRNINKAETLLRAKRYEEALPLLTNEWSLAITTGERNQEMRLLLDIGRALLGKREYNEALTYTARLISAAQETKAKQYLRDGFELMFILHDKLKHVDSAYLFYTRYVHMKDSVGFDALLKRMAIHTAFAETEQKEAEIELLGNERIINQQRLELANQRIKSESLTKNMLLGGSIVVLLLGAILFRNIDLKRKNERNRHKIIAQALALQKSEDERIKSDLQQEARALEMQALRAQMNPHFIFNSLNSINHFILKNDGPQASAYLTKFSRLVRLILQHSQHALITLEHELEALQLYLELESLRFDHHFEYVISVAEDIDTSHIKVPPLIIQPYVENAIWHGIMHKPEKGHLRIELSLQEDQLCCGVIDDGVGRQVSRTLKKKHQTSHQSLGMRITADRIAAMQQENAWEDSIKIKDLVQADGTPCGTEVFIKIPLKYD